MSKVVCKCGHVLSDNTDYISYKARFIADQDFFDFLMKKRKRINKDNKPIHGITLVTSFNALTAAIL